MERHAMTRWGAMGYACVYTVLGVPAAFVWSLYFTGLALSPVLVGVPLVMLMVPLTERLARALRYLAARGLLRHVPSHYATTSERGGGTVRAWLTDPARWQDFAGLLIASSIGWLLTALPFVFMAFAIAVVAISAAWTPELPFWNDVFGAPWTSSAVDLAVSLVVSAGLVALAAVSVVPLVTARMHLDRAVLSGDDVEALHRRIDEVTASRNEHVDSSAAELRRIERDLHDGAQARLASLTMTLGLAQEMVERDPETAKRLLAEAKDGTATALKEIRGIVRGVVPPVLADRGLGPAIDALAVDLPLPVTTRIDLDGRLPAPVESTLYFTIGEALANVVKHAQATRAWVRLEQRGDLIVGEIGDDGHGGARLDGGTGLAGVVRRLAVLDGRLTVWSPEGGPTVVSVEVPCASSSPRTTPSSGTA